MKAMFAQLFKEGCAKKVRRGMEGLLATGKSPGGRAHEHMPNRANRGVPTIVPDEAAIVLRIFQEYHDGKSPKAIYRDLTAEGISASRGKRWGPSVLYGSTRRGTGMLRNPIYKGVIVWNKVHMVADHDTDKRISRPNPKSE